MAREFQKRDKHVQKMSRDGLVEKNLATGEEERVSQRGQDFQLGKTATPQDTSSFRESLNRENARSHARQVAPPVAPSAESDSSYSAESTAKDEPITVARQNDSNIRPSESPQISHETTALPHSAAGPSLQNKAQSTYRKQDAPADSVQKTSAYQSRFVADVPRFEAPLSTSPLTPIVVEIPIIETPPDPLQSTDLPLGRLQFAESAPTKNSAGDKTVQSSTAYQRRFVKDAPASDTATSDSPHDSTSSERSSPEHGSPQEKAGDPSAPKGSKLHFSADEKPPVPAGSKLKKAQHRAERTTEKLETAKKRLPKKHTVRLEKQFDADSGKVQRKLRFETQVKSKRQHLKGALPLRPIKVGANVAIGYGHKKLRQVEHENVGTEAAHKGELAVEGGLRRAYRMHKTAPYRRVAKLERLSMKRGINLSYQKALAENPKLKSNLLSRIAQKQKIKRQYAKAAREAKRAGVATKKVASATGKLAMRIVTAIKNHSAAVGVIIGLLLLIFFIMSSFSSCSNMVTGGLSGILASSYLAEDADIDNAELAYSDWETDLQIQVNNAESDHPNYDEYKYQVGDIGHDPYELMAYLTAKYQDFTFAAVEADLQSIFAEQYQLSFVEEIEIRYRTEYYYDDEGELQSEEVPYNWYILNINLTARSFTDVISTRLDSDQREMYDLLMDSKGNRQYTLSPFDFDWIPYISCYYGWRVHPITGAKDNHKAVDIAVAAGTEIRAAHDGVVTIATWHNSYGNYIALDDGNGLVTKYAHCNQLLVSAGQEVSQGDVIALVGSTGDSTGSHLHFEVIKDGVHLNPLFFSESVNNGSTHIAPGSPGGVEFPEYPGAPLGDGSYAALIAEGELHLGKSYVFGANGPANFDCSSFASWVLDKSGVHPMSRTNAWGLYTMSTAVSPENAQPGDLIFFQGTYSSANPTSHVGIFVGNNMMLHCGNPVQYTSINTSYWQEHFYSFARIPD